MTHKREYEDDPEGYWELKHDQEEQGGKDALEAWEKMNPSIPYGWRTPNE